MSPSKRILAVFVPLLSAGCGASTEPEDSPEVGVHVEPIVREVPGANLVSRVRRTDARVTLVSYAMPEVQGCSGAMIGPRIMMSAAHCGTGTKTITFHLYNQADETASISENFTCRYLIHTHEDTDMALYYCDPNAAGELPGEKYGYADFDIVTTSVRTFDLTASKAKVQNGNFVRSIWRNPVDELGLSTAMLHSTGELRDVDANTPWYSPVGGPFVCGVSGNMQLDAPSTLWSKGGASGSSVLSSNFKIIAGPQSTGVNDGPGRGMLSIADYLYWGYVTFPDTRPCGIPTSNPQVNSALISSLGLTPANYSGWIDKELDGAFDIQKDIEAAQLETVRNVYWLGFESHRRNLLWRDTGNGTVDFLGTGGIRLATGPGASGYKTLLVHDKLKLTNGAVYRLKYRVKVLSSAASSPLSICSGTRCFAPSTTTGTWLTKAGYVYGGPGGELSLAIRENTSLELSSIELVRDGTSIDFDFDTHDQRIAWAAGSPTPFYWPIGNGTGVDWAAAVRRTGTNPAPITWSLSGQLALSANKPCPSPPCVVQPSVVRVCFDVRHGPIESLDGIGNFHMVDSAGEVPGSYFEFTPTTSWTRACSTWFTVASQDTRAEFGTRRMSSGAPNTGYVIDNVTVQR